MTTPKIAIGIVAAALFVGSVMAHGCGRGPVHPAGVRLQGRRAADDAYKRGDYTTALRIIRQLADQNDAFAQNSLGVMYAKGQGVPQDYREAVKWFRRLADQGNANAQSNLGFMYQKGWGVTQDYAEAMRWYNLSAAQGNDLGRRNRDSLAEKMTPAQIAEAKKLAREWKPKGK